MSDRPDQWYLDALDSKHQAEARMLTRQVQIAIWWPKIAALAVIACLAVIAMKL